MKTFRACLVAGVALGLPLSVLAQSPDSRYCEALAQKYAGFLAAMNQPQDPQTISGRVGINQCQAGNTAVGISLLESSLRNVGMDLPPREAPRPSYIIQVTHGPQR